MPKTLEKMRKELLALDREREREVAKVEKSYAGEISIAHEQLQKTCKHELVIERREHYNDELLGLCEYGCPIPHQHSTSEIRVCCICAFAEHSGYCSPHTEEAQKGKYAFLTVEPFRYFYSDEEFLVTSFTPMLKKYFKMPLPKLRAEAERLREERKGGE